MAKKPETIFEEAFLEDLKDLLPGAYIFKMDPSIHGYGIPDRLILFGNTWMSLEFKKASNARRQPLQEHHVRVMNDMAFSRFVSPENREEIMREICDTFGVGR